MSSGIRASAVSGTSTIPSPRWTSRRPYLTDFARTHGLRERIEFDTAVESVTPAADEGWRVRLGSDEESTYDAVIAAELGVSGRD